MNRSTFIRNSALGVGALATVPILSLVGSSPLTAKYMWKYFDMGSQFGVALLFYDGDKRVWGNAVRKPAPFTDKKFNEMAGRLWADAPHELINRLADDTTTITIEGDFPEPNYHWSDTVAYDPSHKLLWVVGVR